MSGGNPFDEFDDYEQSELRSYRPTLSERFSINFDSAQRTGTFGGAARDYLYKEIVPPSDTARETRKAFDRRYESMPQWETPLEGAVALTGQIAGTVVAPENFIPIGLGAKVVGLFGGKATGVGARALAGATDAAVSNAVIDSGIQGVEIEAGFRKDFNTWDLAVSTLLGAGIGGAAGALTRPKPVIAADETMGERYDRLFKEREGVQEKAEPAPVVQTAPELPAVPASDMPATDIPMQPLNAASAADGNAGIRLFDPRSLKVDANRFQFKSNGDADGVTDALRTVTQWRPERGNQLIVWQDNAGELFVVDGHQRTGLARRLLDQGNETDIQIPGVLLREADGVTADKAMETAALKNIAEGSATPVDGAKILKVGGAEALKDMPMSKDAVRTSVDLSRLADEPWRMVINEVVQPNHAKFVGRFIPDDPVRQEAAMKALARAEPANEAEAAVLVRRVMSAELDSANADAQGDMFGISPESTVLEEVKIVAAAVQQLRSDKRLFSRLLKDAEKIEQTGSRIEREAAQNAVASSDVIVEHVERLAFRSGEIRDALVVLAKDVKNGKSSNAAAARQLVEALRGGKAADGNGRLEAGASRGDGEPGRTDTGGEAPYLFDDNEPLASVAATRVVAPDGAPLRDKSGIASSAESSPEFVRLRDISEKLLNLLDPAAVRQGRFTVKGAGGKVMGQYAPRTGVVRVRNIDDFDTLTHELGHHVEVLLKAPLQKVLNAHSDQVKSMAYPLASDNVKLKEGFAEYIRLRTTNPAYATKAAPEFDAAFDTFLRQQRPDIADGISEAAAAYRQWLEQPSRQAVASSIVSAKKPSWFEKAGEQYKKVGVQNTIADYLGRAYTAMVDDLHPLQQAVRQFASIHKSNTGTALDLKVMDNPYKLMRLGRAASSTAHMDIMHGVTPYRGVDPTSASLRDALIEAVGAPNVLGRMDDTKVRDFGSYLWSRRALGEWERFDAGDIPNKPDKFTRGDHEQNIAELLAESPQFEAAAAKVYDWNHALWTKKFQSGLITKEQWDAGLQIKDYVPGLRHFDDEGGGAGRSAPTAKSGSVRQFRGSTRDVVNPIDSLIADAYQTSIAIWRNDAVRALDKLALRAGNGGGTIAERIPSHELKAKVIDPLEAVSAAGKAAGLSAEDTISVRDLVESTIGDTKATLFRPQAINERGEPILFFREGGQLRALRLADGDFGKELLRNFELAPPVVADVAQGILARGSSIARAGITSSPDFILANFLRDQITSILFYGKPFQRIQATVRGMADEIFTQEAARKYNSFGGIMGGSETAALRDTMVNRDLRALSKKGWAAQRLTSIKGLMEVAEISETGTRIGLFKTFFDEARLRGLTEVEGLYEAAWRARDHIDFDRRGSRMAALSRITPFLNASIQGFDKGARAAVAPLVRRGRVLAEDALDAANAQKIMARIGVLTAGGLALHALMSDDEDYRELSSHTRSTHWAVRMGGKFFVVPKPFEAIPFLSAAEAAWDALAYQDPRSANVFLDGLYKSAPPMPLLDNPVVKSVYEVWSNFDTFSGTAIVPDELLALEPHLRVTAQTSALGAAIADVAGVSPGVVDHVITNFFGSWGRSALAMADLASGEKPAMGWDDAPFLRRFIKDASKGSRSTRAFWNEISTRAGKLEGVAQSYKTMMQAGDEEEGEAFLNRQDARTRAFVTASLMPAKVQRMHPIMRARNAVRAIGALRRDVSFGRLGDADGKFELTRAERGVADDILSDLAMAEARNALVDTGAAGYKGREIIDTGTYMRELAAVSPRLHKALADRYANPRGKVMQADLVRKGWPELQKRLLRDGTGAQYEDLSNVVEDAGTELGGRKIPQKVKPKVNSN